MRLTLLLWIFILECLSDEILKLSPADYDNYLFRDDKTSAQIVLSKANANSTTIQTRFLIAFPAGNSGALAMFNLSKSSDSQMNPIIQLVEQSLSSISKDNHFLGVTGGFSLDLESLVQLPIMGSVRTLRDFTEAGVKHSEMIVKVFQQRQNSISFTYPFLDKVTSMNFTILAPSNQLILYDDLNGVAVLSPGNFTFEVTVNIPSLTPLSVDKLIRSERKDLANQFNVKSLAFLTYGDKFLAGGWHFLTYFGRDTLISTRLLLPILSTDATEAAMGAVLDRMNSDNGELCHEETIGDYATWINQQNGHPELGSTPFYDYKMMDTNFQLLPLLACYFLDESTGKDRASVFLNRTQMGSQITYQTLLEKNVALVMGSAKKFADDPSSYVNLVQIKQNEPVGNWRDSEAGLGWGRFPYDINVAMMPSCLLAIERLSNAKILDSTLATMAAGYRKIWEEKALLFFTVKPKQPQDSLAKYLNAMNLPASLYSTSDSLPDSIHALSLRSDGSHVVVMHSDISFNLMYHDALTTDYMKYVLAAMEPFPRGLMVEGVGLLVANPAYDYENETNWNVFSRTAYHGACVWAFQQSMLVMGIDRQFKLCSTETPPEWCDDAATVLSLKSAQCKLWSTIVGNVIAESEETWTWDYDTNQQQFVIKTPSELSSKAMESDAVQLWSFVLLAANPPSNCPSTTTSTKKAVDIFGFTHFNVFNFVYVLLSSVIFARHLSVYCPI